MNLGATDVMSPQEKARYKEAVPQDFEPQAPTPVTIPVRDDSYVVPKGATIRMPDGRLITKDQYDKLQAKLKQRRG